MKRTNKRDDYLIPSIYREYISMILLIFIIIAFGYIYYTGQYIKKEIHIIDVCNGVPVDWSDEYAVKLYPEYAPNYTIEHKSLNITNTGG